MDHWQMPVVFLVENQPPAQKPVWDICAFYPQRRKELRMINLFQDIPAETIETTLDMIQRNLDQIGLYGGHTCRYWP